MKTPLGLGLAAVLIALPVLVHAQAREGLPAIPSAPAAKPASKPTTVEGVTVTPAAPHALPTHPCAPKDTSCITLVVQTLKTQYPEAFRNLSFQCMNQQATHMAETVEASNLAITSGEPNPGIDAMQSRASDGESATCNIVWREARQK